MSVPARTPVRQRTIAKARTLLEALPFIHEHAGSTIVIKLGGAAVREPALFGAFAQDLALLRHVGIAPVIVRDGGLRVGHIADAANPAIVTNLRAGGVPAAGISGADGDGSTLRPLLEKGLVPVVACIAADEDGEGLDVDADLAAAGLAVGLGATKLLYVSDVAGVLDAAGELFSELSVEDALDLLARSEVGTGGVIPKLEGAVRALKGGVRRIHLLDGRVPHALVLELFTPEGIGTLIAAGADGPVDSQKEEG